MKVDAIWKHKKSDEKKKVNLIRDTNLVQDSFIQFMLRLAMYVTKVISTYYSSAAWNTQLNYWLDSHTIKKKLNECPGKKEKKNKGL